MWKLLVFECHLSTKVDNNPESRKVYPVGSKEKEKKRKVYRVCVSPHMFVAFRAGSHQYAVHFSCLKLYNLPLLLTTLIKSRSCKIQKI
jgi:hypothetical protein